MKQYKITSAMFRGEDDTLPDCVLPDDDMYNSKNMSLTNRAEVSYNNILGLEELTKNASK
jgi:hypothetical protein